MEKTDNKNKKDEIVSLHYELKKQVEANAPYMSMGDLLDLFQGATPLPGSVMIATTNKMQLLNKLYPTLFRHGRLTPIYFGYFNGKLIKDICYYYFKQTPDIDDNMTPNIMNSLIMEWILLCMDEEDGYEIFMKNFNEHLRKNKSMILEEEREISFDEKSCIN